MVLWFDNYSLHQSAYFSIWWQGAYCTVRSHITLSENLSVADQTNHIVRSHALLEGITKRRLNNNKHSDRFNIEETKSVNGVFKVSCRKQDWIVLVTWFLRKRSESRITSIFKAVCLILPDPDCSWWYGSVRRGQIKQSQILLTLSLEEAGALNISLEYKSLSEF